MGHGIAMRGVPLILSPAGEKISVIRAPWQTALTFPQSRKCQWHRTCLPGVREVLAPATPGPGRGHRGALTTVVPVRHRFPVAKKDNPRTRRGLSLVESEDQVLGHHDLSTMDGPRPSPRKRPTNLSLAKASGLRRPGHDSRPLMAW